MRSEAREYYDRKISKFPDAKERIFQRYIPADISKITDIHISGVCGTAMGSLAALLVKKGYKLSGSDVDCYPPMSDLIASLGINFKKGFSGENLKDAQLVIIGNVCGADNPEAQYARENNIPTLSLPEAIATFFFEGKKPIVLAGTHGKTTTTGLMAHVLADAGMKPGYMVGGVMQGGEDSSAVGEGEYFVIEGDEYDTAYFDKSPKFLHYQPYMAVVTSVEFDHVDIYANFEEYKDAFKFLSREIPDGGRLFLCGDNEYSRALWSENPANCVYYGLDWRNDFTAKDVLANEKGQEFNLVWDGIDKGRFFVPLSGAHNLSNTLAVCGVALHAGMSEEALRKGLASFKGMKRRQEVVAEVNGITILDDFAHHPTAVRETISAIKSKYPRRRLVALFEPRSNTSRRKIFEEDYGNSFSGSDIVLISTPPLRSNDDPAHFIDPSHVVSVIKSNGIESESFSDPEQLLENAYPRLKEGDVVLIMSNGSFGGIHKKLAERINR